MIEIHKVTQDLVTALKRVTPNVYPIVAPQGTSLPFITYSRSGIGTDTSKDGEYDMDIYYQLNIITQGYDGGLQLVDAVRTALRTITSNHYRYEVTVTGSSEEAYDDGYAQHFNFTINASR